MIDVFSTTTTTTTTSLGLDTVAAILRVMQSGTGDPKFAPCPLLVQMVDAGWLGKKAFRGVYHYAEPLN